MPRRSSTSVRIFYPELNREQLLRRISEKLPELNQKIPLKFVVLFGSYAKGNYTVASDVDLLVVYEGPARKDAYMIVKKTIEIPRLEPHVYSLKEYEEMKETVTKMTQGGILLIKV